MKPGNFKTVNWGIIGVGDVCEVKSGPALQQTEGSNLVAVMRRNGDKARDFAQRHGVPKWYDDADALINDPDINAIYIATPPDSHEAYTLKAAAAGKPVYVEKPMARNHQECLSMIKACEQAGVPLFVAYYRRALPNFLKVKELLQSGIIGDVRFVNITLQRALRPDFDDLRKNSNNWRVIPEIAGGGYFYDLAAHQLDLMDFFFGPIQHAQGIALNQAGLYPAEDVVMGSFLFQNGILGQGIWAFNTNEAASKEVTTIIGSKGQITFPIFGDHHVKLEVDGSPAEVFRFDISRHIQSLLIQSIVEELRGKGSCSSTGVSGARTNWVMEKICNMLDGEL